jgi:hypothetical protein
VVRQDLLEAGEEGGLDEDLNLICFHCDGTGERWVAVKVTYGDDAGERERVRMLSRDNDAYQRSLSRAITSTSRSWVERSDTLETDGTALSYDSDAGDNELDARQVEVLMTEAKNDSMNSDKLRLVSRSDSEKYECDSSLVVPATLDKCWVCRGTGVSSSAMLMSSSEATTGGGECKIVGEDDDEDDDDDDENVCLICWSEPIKFGLSTSCSHCFCEDCIRGHLKNIQMTGSFPGYCPLCESSAPDGEVPRYGRIDGKAMTFLQRRKVIEKEFQFLFMRKQNEESTDSFFACPAGCGNYLIDVDPTYVLRDGETRVKTERCPCGVGEY